MCLCVGGGEECVCVVGRWGEGCEGGRRGWREGRGRVGGVGGRRVEGS